MHDSGLRLLSALLLLAVWQAALLSGSALLPGPAAVARALVEDATQGYLLSDLGYTLARVAASFVIAMAAGSAIGMLMGRSRRVDGLFDLWLVLGLNMPALVIIILCYLWIGLNETAAIAAVA
ncbi:MAG TPA: ABC transporter permease, partial [Stellaceae bacterium]|nr:ABC transporter permease [Stellaceae bacterium]